MAADGYILLGFLAVLFAAVLALLRRKIGLPVTTRMLAWTITGFVVVVLALWASSGR